LVKNPNFRKKIKILVRNQRCCQKKASGKCPENPNFLLKKLAEDRNFWSKMKKIDNQVKQKYLIYQKWNQSPKKKLKKNENFENKFKLEMKNNGNIQKEKNIFRGSI